MATRIHWDRLSVIPTKRRLRHSALASDLLNYALLVGSLGACAVALATLFGWPP